MPAGGTAAVGSSAATASPRTAADNCRLREKRRRSCRHHRLLRTTAARERYDKSAPDSKDNCDSSEPNRMESCETSAPNNLVLDDMTAWSLPRLVPA